MVAGNAIQAVVPLLTFYSDVDGEGPTYQCALVHQGVAGHLCAACEHISSSSFLTRVQVCKGLAKSSNTLLCADALCTLPVARR